MQQAVFTLLGIDEQQQREKFGFLLDALKYGTPPHEHIDNDKSALSISSQNQIESEAISALITLGYKPQEASKIINKVLKPNMDCETLIKEALKSAL